MKILSETTNTTGFVFVIILILINKTALELVKIVLQMHHIFSEVKFNFT